MDRHTQSASRRRAARSFVLLVGALAVGVPALGALTQGADALQGEDPLDALRAEVPEGFPGESDLTEANEKFGRLVELYGETTDVEEFGDDSILTGPCGGYVFSYDKNGDLLDAAVDFGDSDPPIDLLDGGQAFSASNRFRVDPRGLVQYFGFAPLEPPGPTNHTWWIKTSGISLDRGGDPNANGKNRNEGIVDLDQDLPVKFTANIEIEGRFMSPDIETCVGKGHVSVEGDGLTDPVGIAGLALLGGGVFGLLFNARPAMTYRG